MDNSKKEAEKLFELIKSKIRDGDLKLLHHRYKRKYVETEVLSEYKDFVIIEEECKMFRYTSDIFGKPNEGLNRDGWKFEIVGTFKSAIRPCTKSFTTHFKNRHKNYGTLVHQSGWSCQPYLNINNQGIEFELPKKELIGKWVEPHKLLKKMKKDLHFKN